MSDLDTLRRLAHEHPADDVGQALRWAIARIGELESFNTQMRQQAEELRRCVRLAIGAEGES